jgi:hypothetical protein
MNTKPALDYILGSKYTRAIVKNHPDGYGAGFLLNVSGVPPAFRTIRKLLDTGRCPFVRGSGAWDDDHHFTAADIDKVKIRAYKFGMIADAYPQAKFFFQPLLEPHHVSEKLTKRFLKAAKGEMPRNVKLVTGNNHGGRKVWREGHHTGWRPGQRIFSFDGLDAMHSNMGHWINKTHGQVNHFYLWVQEFNGSRWIDRHKPRKPRSQRTHWATGQHIKDVVERYERFKNS